MQTIPVDYSKATALLDLNEPEAASDPEFWRSRLGLEFALSKSRLLMKHESNNSPAGLITPLLTIISVKEQDPGVGMTVSARLVNPEDPKTSDFYRFVRRAETVFCESAVSEYSQSEKYIKAAYHPVFYASETGFTAFDVFIPENVSGIVYNDRVSTEVSFVSAVPGMRMNMLVQLAGPPMGSRRKTPNPYVRFSPKITCDTVFFASKEDMESVSVPLEVAESTYVPEFTKRESGAKTVFRGGDGSEYSVVSDISRFLVSEDAGYVSGD